MIRSTLKEDPRKLSSSPKGEKEEKEKKEKDEKKSRHDSVSLVKEDGRRSSTDSQRSRKGDDSPRKSKHKSDASLSANLYADNASAETRAEINIRPSIDLSVLLFSFISLDPLLWTETHVAIWLQQISEASLVSCFDVINGVLLMNLDDEQLTNLGVTSASARKKIMQEIQNLKENAPKLTIKVRCPCFRKPGCSSHHRIIKTGARSQRGRAAPLGITPALRLCLHPSRLNVRLLRAVLSYR